MQEFLAKMGAEYLNLIGSRTAEGVGGKFSSLGAIRALPTSFLIDRQGQIYQRFIGFTERKVFEKAIKKLL